MSDEKVLTKEIAEQFLADEYSVDLNEFTSIEDAAAESLGKYEGDLYLDGLTEISDTAAEVLSKHEGRLSLGGLTHLSDAVVESLSNHKSELSFHYLEKITDQQAYKLVFSLGTVRWPTAETLAFRNKNGKSISPQAIAASRKQEVNDDLLTVVDNVADMLCNTVKYAYGHLLRYACLRHEIQMELANNCGRITSALVKKIANLEEDYEINLLSKEDICVCEEQNLYAACDFLANGTSIDDKAAGLLTKREGDLCLGDLVTLSDGAAELLSEYEGNLIIELNSLPESAAAILRKHPSFADED